MERYLRVNLLGQGPCLMKKKNLPGRGLTKFEKHCFMCLRYQSHVSKCRVFQERLSGQCPVS